VTSVYVVSASARQLTFCRSVSRCLLRSACSVFTQPRSVAGLESLLSGEGSGALAECEGSGRSGARKIGQERSRGTGADFRAWLGRLCGSEDCVSSA